MNLKRLIDKYATQYGRFDLIKNPPSTHRDLCAMLILEKFMTNPKTSVINSVNTVDMHGHPEEMIVFEPSIHAIETMATEDQVIDLIRCGCRYNGEYEALVMDI